MIHKGEELYHQLTLTLLFDKVYIKSAVTNAEEFILLVQYTSVY